MCTALWSQDRLGWGGQLIRTPEEPALLAQHHHYQIQHRMENIICISAKMTLSLLWTFGQFPKDLEHIAIKNRNATLTKKGMKVKGFIDSGIFFVLEGLHLHRPPYFVKPKLPGTEYFSEYSPLSLSSLNLHLIIISKNGRGASFWMRRKVSFASCWILSLHSFSLQHFLPLLWQDMDFHCEPTELSI